MTEIAVLRTHIVNYTKTRPVYDAYRKADTASDFWKTIAQRSHCTRQQKRLSMKLN